MSISETLINSTGWRPGMGPAPGVFKNKPLGHRAIFSCNWEFPNGLKTADDMLPLGEACQAELLAEGLDVLNRMRPGEVCQAVLAQLVIQALTGDITNDFSWRLDMRSQLAELRPSYPQYQKTWGATFKHVFLIGIRPGW